jgi:hypothetical protein
MTKDEARELKLQDAGSYFRSFSGKRNFAPPSDQSNWYHLASVEIDNNSPFFGEEVGVVEKWEHPAKRASDLSQDIIRKIMDEVGNQPRWREHSKAEMWVGKVVAKVMSLNLDEDLARIKATIRELKKKRALIDEIALDKKRMERTFVVAGDWVAPGC